MIKLIKKYWLVFVLLIICIILVFTKLSIKEPEKPIIITKKIDAPVFEKAPLNNQVVPYQLNFSWPANIPKELPVYKITAVVPNNYPELNNTLSGPETIFNDTQALDKTKEFLTEKGITDDLNDFKINYFDVEKMNMEPATSSANIDIFSVGFWPLINNVRVVTGQPNAPLNNVLVGKNGQIQKAQTIDFKYQKEDKFLLKNYSEVQQAIINQKGSVVWIDNVSQYEGFSSVSINSIVLNNISLSYYLSSTGFKYIEPIFVLTGYASVDGQNTPIETAVYLPAIKEEYFYN